MCTSDWYRINLLLTTRKLNIHDCWLTTTYIQYNVKHHKRTIGDSAIKRVIKTKTLGVIIDANLSWGDQIQNIVTKASKGM